MNIRILLLPFSLLYGMVVIVRNWFFEIQILRTTRVEVPVVSVGNISAGGVGKTPLVELLIEKLSAVHRCAVVSRGYGRISTGTTVVSDGKELRATVEQSGDEPSQIAGKFPEAIVVAAEQRVRGAHRAIELGADVLILDDGFQHRYLDRDFNIVVIPAREVMEGDWLLPAGNRREPMSSLKRADLIVVSRCTDRAMFDAVEPVLKCYRKPVAGVRTKLGPFKNVQTNECLPVESFQRKRAIAFSGIGNPESFAALLNHHDIEIVQHVVFPDHHWYCEEDLTTVREAYEQKGAEIILTTEKDAVRLQRQQSEPFIHRLPLYAAQMRLEFLAGEHILDGLLEQIIVGQQTK